MKKIAETPGFGTLDWVKTNDHNRMSAYYGSMEEYKKIPSKWEDFKIMQFDKDNSAAEKYKLDHGYDESKPESELDIEDMKQAASSEAANACLTPGPKAIWLPN